LVRSSIFTVFAGGAISVRCFRVSFSVPEDRLGAGLTALPAVIAAEDEKGRSALHGVVIERTAINARAERDQAVVLGAPQRGLGAPQEEELKFRLDLRIQSRDGERRLGLEFRPIGGELEREFFGDVARAGGGAGVEAVFAAVLR
jgi:hypothetical protein